MSASITSWSRENMDSFDMIAYNNEIKKKLLEFKLLLKELHNKEKINKFSINNDINKLKNSLATIISYTFDKEQIMDKNNNIKIEELKNLSFIRDSNLYKYLDSDNEINIILISNLNDLVFKTKPIYIEYLKEREYFIKNIDYFISMIENRNYNYDKYDHDSKILLTEFNNLKSRINPMIYHNVSENKLLEDKLYNVILQFINLANIYCDLSTIIDNNLNTKKYKNNQTDGYCKFCGERTTVNYGDNLTCNNCGYIYTVLEEESSYKDITRVSASTKYIYDAISTFTDIISRYQGNKHKQLNETMLKNVTHSLYNNGLISQKEFDFSNDQLRHSIFSQITKQHLRKSLKETGNSTYYNDINYLYSYLTGNQVEDISYLEKTLIEEYRLLYDTFKSIRSTKKNMIKGSFILYKLLEKHGYSCDPSDFNLARTPEKIREYELEYTELCRILQWISD